MSTRVYFEEYGDPQVLKVGTEKPAEPGDGLVAALGRQGDP